MPRKNPESLVKKALTAFIAFKASRAMFRMAAPAVAVSGIGYYLFRKLAPGAVKG